MQATPATRASVAPTPATECSARAWIAAPAAARAVLAGPVSRVASARAPRWGWAARASPAAARARPAVAAAASGPATRGSPARAAPAGVVAALQVERPHASRAVLRGRLAAEIPATPASPVPVAVRMGEHQLAAPAARAASRAARGPAVLERGPATPACRAPHPTVVVLGLVSSSEGRIAIEKRDRARPGKTLEARRSLCARFQRRQPCGMDASWRTCRSRPLDGRRPFLMSAREADVPA